MSLLFDEKREGVSYALKHCLSPRDYVLNNIVLPDKLFFMYYILSPLYALIYSPALARDHRKDAI